MFSNYYLPLEFDKIILKKRNPVCSMEDSIKQFLNLILTTHLGEYRYDTRFGCKIWDLNYSNIHSVNKWKESFKKQVTGSIIASEKRLKNVEVKIQLIDPTTPDKNEKISAKHRQKIIISVEGIMSRTNKPFYHQEVIFFSPLSII